jgi:3-hydroxyisobutyrate dehydrogenase-like beta-hydroxyacid dehydrogenase
MSAGSRQVGFLGLGLMGMAMVRRLIAAGLRVHVWNRSPSRVAEAVAAGAVAADSPAAVVSAADVVLMCVLDTQAVEQVVFGSAGVASTPAAGRLLIDHASIRPDATRALAARLREANGMRWIDAPVSGGVEGAGRGALAVMCGGDQDDVDRVRPVLAAYASTVTRMGSVGAGQSTKLCNQVIVATTIAVINEAVRLAQAAGVDPARLPEALAGGWADSRPLRVFVPRMVDPDPLPIGAADTMLKDLDTALSVAHAAGVPLPVAACAAELFRQMSACGMGGEDPSRMVDLYRRRPEP